MNIREINRFGQSGHTDLKNILKKNGYRVTPSRLSILGIFAHSNHGSPAPRNAEYIAKKARKIGGRHINEVTVYRTLSTFEKSGILKRVDLRKDSAYFEINDVNGHHHHIVCIKCGEIEDFKICDIDSLIGNIAAGSSKFKYRNIKEHSLELFGLCTQCA